MRRTALLIVVGVTSCIQLDTTRREGDKSNGYACNDAWSCESGQCLALGENTQNKPGICVSTCRRDTQCANDERCATSPGGSSSYCLKACTHSTACADGFVCTGHEPSVCFVEPKATSGGSCARSVYGSCQSSSRTECSEKAGVSDADRANDEAACTATAGAIWSDGPCPLLDLVGGCRQGCTPTNQVTWYYQGGPYASRSDVDAHCRVVGLSTVASP